MVDKEELPHHGQTDALLDSAAICTQGLQKISSDRFFYIGLSIGLVILQVIYLCLLGIEMPEGLRVFMGLVSLILMVVFIYFLLMGTVWNWTEYNGILSTKVGIECLIEQIRQRNIRNREEERKRFLSNAAK